VIVDTNVLLRALEGDASAHGEAVRNRIETARATAQRLTVLSATVLEVAYVLESARAGYGWDRDVIARAVAAVIDEPAFDVEHCEALRQAAASYRARSFDLHDCFLSALANERHTRVLSFDDDLRRLGNSERP
jgi:predicted nucleic-acid-binding protein